jgi:hypothetical protein
MRGHKFLDLKSSAFAYWIYLLTMSIFWLGKRVSWAIQYLVEREVDNESERSFGGETWKCQNRVRSQNETSGGAHMML